MNFSRYLLATLLFVPSVTHADDSSGNLVAARIKYGLISEIRTNYKGGSGFCDVMILMKHKDGYAIVKRVSTTGDSKLCRFIKSKLKRGSKFRYDYQEKLIQIEIEHY